MNYLLQIRTITLIVSTLAWGCLMSVQELRISSLMCSN